MFKFLSQNIDFYILILLTVIGGYVNEFLGVGLSLAGLLILIANNRQIELVIYLFTMFLFSDSAMNYYRFAGTVKPVLVLLGGLSIIFSKKIKNKNFNDILLFLPFFIFAIFISLKYSVYLTSIQKTISYLIVLSLVFISVPHFLENKNSKEKFYKFLVYHGLLVLIVCLLYGFLTIAGKKFDGRLNGIFRNPNGLGIFLVVYYALSRIIFQRAKELFAKHFYFFFYAVIALVALQTGSRNTLVSIIIFESGYFLAQFGNWLVLLSFILIFYFNEMIFNEIQVLIEQFGEEKALRSSTLSNASGRIYAWRAAWLEINRSTFYVGGGFAYSESVPWLKQYYRVIPQLIEHYGNIHNFYLTLWMNTGLIGILLYITGWIRLIFRFRASKMVLPLLFAVAFNVNYESWLMASLNPYTIIFLTAVMILIYDSSIFVTEENLNKTDLALDGAE